MRHLRFPSLLACCFLAAAAYWSDVSIGSSKPDEKSSRQQPLYNANRDHLWNRLHEALLVRTGPDGRDYGHDRLEPLLWTESKYLLRGPRHERAVSILDEFIKKNGEKLIKDPLKRAMLQRDLLLVYRWVESRHPLPQGTPVAKRPELEKQLKASQERLSRPLAKVIHRLALSPEQFKKLPDNYAAAVASGKFPKSYNTKESDEPYLPPKLFAADGPWVCLGRPDGPIAPAHVREPNPFTSSVFVTFIRLPGGRTATIRYLKRLREFDQPLLVKAQAKGNRQRGYLPNPKLPQFPVGTEVALVRQALLIDSAKRATATSLTESVQLRVYREIPKITPESLNAALTGGTNASRKARREWQSSYEFRLSRARLFAGQAGGLHAVGIDERDFKTGFNAHPWDEFDQEYAKGRTFAQRSQIPIRQNCFACHSLPGVFSFNSYFPYRFHNWQSATTARPATLTEQPPE